MKQKIQSQQTGSIGFISLAIVALVFIASASFFVYKKQQTNTNTDPASQENTKIEEDINIKQDEAELDKTATEQVSDEDIQ